MSEIHTATAHIGSISMPAGDYWVGDPCYAIPDKDWMTWLERAGYEDDDRFLLAQLQGHYAVGVHTAYGDGSYLDEDGQEYPVDAGLIGAVPHEIAKSSITYMRRIIFQHPFTVTYEEDNGVIVIGHVRVTTDPPNEEGYW